MEKNIKHVGQTSYMPGTEGFTIVVFNANDVPVNSHVYMVDNVRLASAAPELLEALEELTYWVDTSVGIEPHWMGDVRNTINKAKGGRMMQVMTLKQALRVKFAKRHMHVAYRNDVLYLVSKLRSQKT